jgi:transcriptional regulator with XRE-family HTH domain
MIKSFFITELISERLKSARLKLGFGQTQLAKIGMVTRITQVNYETGATEPNTAYLRRIQTTGIDIPYVLFGATTEEILGQTNSNNHIDWPLLQQAFEDVEFFCVRHAPSCPSSYRWKLVERLYDALQVAKASGTSSSADHMELINDMWEES